MMEKQFGRAGVPLDVPLPAHGFDIVNASPRMRAAYRMLRDKGLAEEQAVPLADEMPIPLDPLPPFADDNEFRAYKRVCEAVGFAPKVLIESEILAFMRSNGIKRYDLTRVDAYMRAKAAKERLVWFWRTLRETDSLPFTHIGVGFDTIATMPYDKPIPLRVLARVEQFVREFGDRVCFAVTDYHAPKPDPFIAVAPRDGYVPIVFDVWDEPSFK